MQTRYLAFLPDRRGETGGWRDAFARCARATGMTLIDRPWLTALTQEPPMRAQDGEAEAIVIGTLVRHDDRAPVRELATDAAAAIANTAGAALADGFWGAYVAIATTGKRCWIQRAPWGDLACYHARTGHGMLVASDPLLLRDPGGLALAPDWDAIARQLVAPGIRRRRTCLAPILELGGGERIAAGPDAEAAAFWSPWHHVQHDQVSACPDSAAERLRAVICHAVAAQTAQVGRSLLLLSGGLDSSIVAAALAQSGRDWTALNMVTRASGGDERGHARLVAERYGIALTEIDRDWRRVDVTRSLCAAQPYPIEKSFRQATMAAATTLAEDSGASVILDGGGGDNIFCSLQSAAPLADLLRGQGPGGRAITLLRDIATIAQASHAAVLRQAVRRFMNPTRPYRWPVDLSLLTPQTKSYAASAVDHPWLLAPTDAFPGKSGHIGLLLAALGLAQSPDAVARVPSRSILLAQPIVESCLQIPTWLWYERGRNRAVARRAFAPLLPEANAWRQSKGAMDSFIVEIFEANRPRLREMLADGELARNGLIDRAATLAVLDAPGPVRGHAFDRVMDFADIEAWVAAWR